MRSSTDATGRAGERIDEIAADAHRERPGRKPGADVVEADAARRDDAQRRPHREHRPEELRTADMRRKELGQAAGPGVDQLGNGHPALDERCRAGDVADGRHRAGRHDEVGAEIDRGPRRLRVEHGPDADDAVGVLGADAAQRVLPAARRRRELDDVEPAFEAVGGGAHGRRAIGQPEYGHDPRRADPALDLGAVGHCVSQPRRPSGQPSPVVAERSSAGSAGWP